MRTNADVVSEGSSWFRQGLLYLRLSYSWSDTGSSHSLEVFSPESSKARCANHESLAAPCQCSRFPFFLIPSASGNTDEHLSSAFCGVVNMPVVAAPRFKGHIGYIDLLPGNGCEVAVAGEVHGICIVRFSDRENHFTLER